MQQLQRGSSWLIDDLRRTVNEQAEDEGLWFIARTAPEAYLQKALRRLHARVECALSRTPAETALLHAIDHLRADALRHGIGDSYEAVDVLKSALSALADARSMRWPGYVVGNEEE